VEGPDGVLVREKKVVHRRGVLREFLAGAEPGSRVAVETVGNWYWVTDEVEEAGCTPQPVAAGKAKLMLGAQNKTDRLDCRGLIRLQRAGTLPVVWVPPRELRDIRELVRARMVLVRQHTQVKNRILATLGKYGLVVEGVSDAFGVRGRQVIAQLVQQLPPQTRFVTEGLLEQVGVLDRRIREVEERMGEVLEVHEDLRRLMTLPGVGFIVATVIWTEVGDVSRFPGPEQLAAYAGVVPRVQESGGTRLPSCSGESRGGKIIIRRQTHEVYTPFRYWTG
jgi:transposase